MNNINSIIDNHLTELTYEIETLEGKEKSFEHLRYIQFTFFTEIQNKLVYMVSNGIKLIDNIDKFNKIENVEEKWDFLFEEENWPDWNFKYVKEVFEDAYTEVLYSVLNQIRLIKAELSSKSQYYEAREFTKLITSYLDDFHLKLRNRNGLNYYNENCDETFYKIFNNKLDVICDINLSYTGHVLDDGYEDFLRNPNVYNEFCYPGIFIDREQWKEFEFSCRMIDILNEILKGKIPSNTPKKVNWHLNHKILLLNSLGALDKLPRNHSGDLNKSLAAKVLSLLIEYDGDNIRKALGDLEKQPSKLTEKQRKDQEDVKEILNGLGWVSG